jgi:hypothetical protein
MNNAACYAGLGCTVDLIHGGADICWNLQGLIYGNTTCSVQDVGFCQGINQTAYTQLARSAGCNVTCNTSRGAKTRAKRVLLWAWVLAVVVYLCGT